MKVQEIIKAAKESNNVFKINSVATPTYQSSITYYISGNEAVIHSWAHDQYEFMSDNRYTKVTVNQAREHYRKNK